MAKFTVDRRTWYRGHGSDSSRLLRQDGKRCCIGFVGQQVDCSDACLLNTQSVMQLAESQYSKFPKWMQTGAIQDAYSVNDNSMAGETRESTLKEIFLKHGDVIEFTN